MEIDTKTTAIKAPNKSYAHAVSKIYTHDVNIKNPINEYTSLKNTILCKPSTKYSDFEILSAIEDAGYDKYLYGFQQIRYGTIIEVVMKSKEAMETLLDKGLIINGVRQRFYNSTPSRNISKRVTISILGLPIEKSSFPAGKILEELGYGKHLTTRPIFKETPKKKTLYYSGIIVTTMEGLVKPVPRLINLKGYDVRAIYTGQEDIGSKAQNNATTKITKANNKAQTHNDLTLDESLEETSKIIQLSTKDEHTNDFKAKENENNDNNEDYSKGSTSEVVIRGIEEGEGEDNYEENNDEDEGDESKSDENKLNDKDDEENKGDDDEVISNVRKIDKSNEIEKEIEENVFSKEDSLDDVEIAEDFLKMSHIEKIEYNWKQFKNFDRLNCTKEELNKFKKYKKLEWQQFEIARVKVYDKLDIWEKQVGRLLPDKYEEMDSGEMYGFNMRELKNFDMKTADISEKTIYYVLKISEWKQRGKEHSQFILDHETKKEQRNLKKQRYQITKKRKLSPQL
nr:DNA ligase 1-like [Hydra vulgaris]